MSTDLNRAFMLLSIVDKARAWPNLQGLHDLSMFELQALADGAAGELADLRADLQAKKDEEAAKAKAEADAKAEAETKASETTGADATTTSDSARRL